MNSIKLLRTQKSALPVIEPLKTKLKLACSSRINIVSKENILYLKADSNYCEVHMVDGRTFICSQTMKVIEAKLHPTRFFRPHQSFVFNTKYLNSVSSTICELYIEGDIRIPVSRSKRRELRKMLNQWYD